MLIGYVRLVKADGSQTLALQRDALPSGSTRWKRGNSLAIEAKCGS
jgi:hypothetical protein